jgi:hypothetical protein
MTKNNNETPSPTIKNPSAPERLSQVAGHVVPKKRPRAEKIKDELPANYSDILGQLGTPRTIASTSDTSNKGYVRQKQAGKL